MKRWLLALALVAGLSAEGQEISGGLLGRGSSYSSFVAPASATLGCVGVFLGSPLTLQCDAPVYATATKTLSVPYGAVNAANLTATALGAATVSTVTPVLTQVGSITTVAGAALVDGDYFTIRGTGASVLPIEFDATPGNGTSGGNVPYVFAPGDTADQIRDGLITLINGSTVTTHVVASSGGAATITLTIDTPGTAGGANSENVANAGFGITGFADPTHVTTYGYKVAAFLADGTSTAASSEVTTATGHATLSAADLNRVTWAAVPGAASYKLWRTTGGAAPPKLLYTGALLTYDDIGAAGSANVPPTTDGTGVITAAKFVGPGLGITNSAGNNVIPKSDGTNLVASSITDDGTKVTTTVPIIAPDGTVASPGLRFAGSGSAGFLNSVLGIQYASSNLVRIVFRGDIAMRFRSNYLIGWSSGDPTAATEDTILSRGAAATLQLGAADSATPVAQTLQAQGSRGGTDTNVAGARLQIRPGIGTGTGGGGDFALQTAYPGATGTTANVPLDRLYLAPKWTTLTESSATNLASLAFAASTAVGAEFLVTVEANDGTEYQSLTSRVRVSSIRKGTGNTVSAVGVVGTDLLGASSGTLTCTFAVTEGAASATLTASCVSSLTQTTLRASFQAIANGPVAIAQL